MTSKEPVIDSVISNMNAESVNRARSANKESKLKGGDPSDNSSHRSVLIEQVFS